MIRSRLAALWLVVLVLMGGVSFAEAPRFEAGDRVAFLGDSIFHGGKVHANVLLFQATRFPGQAISVRNAGVSGDTAKGALTRLDWDIKPYDENRVVIMFGMNDVGRWLYGEGKDTQPNIAARQRLLNEHRQAMAKLVQELAGKQIILCTPTPFDQTSTHPGGNIKGVDDALALVADNTRKLAKQRGLGLVDFHSAMNDVLREQQAKDPAFTMMDNARIHPNDAGHMVMTYVLLKAQGISPVVAQVEIDAASGKVAQAVNCTITPSELKDGAVVAFSYDANALPYPVEGAAAGALKWVPFLQDLNQETLRVTGLAAGSYALRIDGQPVGVYSAADLEAGVNLAGNRATPQYKQAAEVAKINEKRRSRESETLRVFAALEHDVLRPRGVDTSNMEAVRQTMEAAIEEEGKAKSWRHSYFINLSKVYYAAKPNQQAIERELADLTAQMFEKAKPTTHVFELVPAGQ